MLVFDVHDGANATSQVATLALLQTRARGRLPGDFGGHRPMKIFGTKLSLSLRPTEGGIRRQFPIGEACPENGGNNHQGNRPATKPRYALARLFIQLRVTKQTAISNL